MNVHAHWGKQSAQSGRAQHPWSVAGRVERPQSEPSLSNIHVVPGGLVLWRLDVLAGEARAVPTELLPVPPSQVSEGLRLVHLARPQRQQQLVFRAREATDHLHGGASRTSGPDNRVLVRPAG